MIAKVTKEDNVINKILGAIFDKKVRMGFELSYFKNYRAFSDGVDLFRVELDLSLKGDHTPNKTLFIGMFNFKLIEMSIYNVNHDDYEAKEDPTDKVMGD